MSARKGGAGGGRSSLPVRGRSRKSSSSRNLSMSALSIEGTISVSRERSSCSEGYTYVSINPGNSLRMLSPI